MSLNALWVAENVRKRGLGRRLVERVCAWAASRGAQEVALEVATSSSAAIELYRSFGFSDLPTPVTCGARQAPAIRMTKRL